MGCLWCYNDCQGHLIELTSLTSVVVDDGRAVWSQAGQEIIGREAYAFGEDAAIPEFKVESQTQVTANIELGCNYFDLSAALGQ